MTQTEQEYAEQLHALLQPRILDEYAVHVPHPAQQVALALPAKEMLFGGAAGGGKALALDTPIRTPLGWTTMSDLPIGALVYDENGEPCKVVWKSEVQEGRPCYRVQFSDGSEIVADQDHKWSVGLAGSRNQSQHIKTTGEMFRTMETAKRVKFYIDVARPLFQFKEEYPIDPYIMGYWLGDGDTRRGYVTIGDSDFESVSALFEACGETLTKLAPMHYKVEGLTKRLISLGIVGPQAVDGVKMTPRPKRIPRQYIEEGNIEQRLALLQGLVDSDGFVDSDIELTTVSAELAKDYLELILSLGIKATIREGVATLNGRIIGPKYRIKFVTDMESARLPRKLARQKVDGFRGTHNKRYITAIIATESVPVQCIGVDSPSHLYLAGRELIPTHNSDFLLMAALRYVDVPGYSAILFRRTYKQLIESGAILDRFKSWMAGKNVKKEERGMTWVFPSGAKIRFGHIHREADKYNYQGAEFQFIGFDEATMFEPDIYTWAFSRLRKPTVSCNYCSLPLTGAKNGFIHLASQKEACNTPMPDERVLNQYSPAERDGMTVFDLPLQVIATANPGGLSHEFFKERFVDPADPDLHDEEEMAARKQRAYIPSTIRDNPSLNQEEYMATLQNLSMVDRERYLNGDWEILEEGNLFKASDFQYVERGPSPDDVKSRVRFWDFAASDGQHSDWTAGALCSITKDGRWFIEDMKRVRALPPDVEKLVKKTAQEDGIGVRVYSEQEPGSSGKALVSYYKRHVLAGWRYDGVRSTGSKTDRAGSLVSQTEGKNVYLVKASWNKAFTTEASLFPVGAHDDQVDAAAGAFVAMTVNAKRKVRLVTRYN